MKIKVIDLLIKYANERVTKNKVRYNKATGDWNENDFLYDIYIEFGNRNNEEIIEFLNDEVEIIEEPKKIEKIPLPSFDEFKRMSAEERYVVTAKEYDLLDELIDEINNLKEK